MANPKLIVLFEQLRGKTFELDKPEMTVGRKDAADICLKDSSLSGNHAVFIRTGSGAYILRDNDSTNGTRINNVPITEQELKNSDIIQFGGVEVLYDCGVADNPSSASVGSRTHTISLDGLDTNMSTVRTMTNYSPFAQAEKKKQVLLHKLIIAGLVLLGTTLLALIVQIVLKVINHGQ